MVSFLINLADIYRCSIEGAVTRPVTCHHVDERCRNYTTCETDTTFTGCNRYQFCTNDLHQDTRENVCGDGEIYALKYRTCLPKRHFKHFIFGKK